MDRAWLRLAVDVSRNAPPSPERYAVGGVIVKDGELLAKGHPLLHAVEVVELSEISTRVRTLSAHVLEKSPA